MKKETIQIEWYHYDDATKLSPEDQFLLNEAHEAAKQAYAPYSHFKVGAAVRLQGGIIVRGNNQENVAYPSGLCAERVALFHAHATYPDKKVEAIAITAVSAKTILDEPVAPCGACRQVMAEYEHRGGIPLKVIMQGQTGRVLVAPSMAGLLPFSFLHDFLDKY
ncbi:MAG: cytidine deaminase [Bacteroidales bacterium]|nr:cytidine deaminase [Bacteroidales bacterium]